MNDDRSRLKVQIAQPVMRKIGLCLLVLLLVPSVGRAQKFFYTQYRPAQGLPSNRVHAVARDSMGFVWVATDAGLVRYDGQTFTTYRGKDEERSIAALVRRPSGGILFADDGGVFAVTPQTDTARVRRLVGAGPQPTDSTVVRPDGLYEDARGRLWISQPNGTVARLHEDRLRTFRVGDNPGGSVSASAASFRFADDAQGRLWTVTRTGQLYQYRPAEARFERVPLPTPMDDARDLRIRNDTLWIAGDRLVRARIAGDDGRLTDVRAYATDGHQLTHMAFTAGGLFVGTQQNGLFLAALEAGTLTLQPVYGANDPHRTVVLPFRNVNHVYVDQRGAMWLSSGQGVGLLQTRFFQSVSSLTNYDTLFLHREEDGILVSFGDAYRVDAGPAHSFRVRPLSLSNESVVSSLASKGRTVWAATSMGKLLKTQDGREPQVYNFADRGGVIYYLYDDDHGNLWFCQAPAEKLLKGVARIGPDDEVTFYDADDGLDNRILSLREAPDGTLYAVGIGPETYLYRYDRDRDRFVNLSRSLSFDYSVNFEVHDLAVGEGGTVWLATTDGLLRYEDERVERVKLGTFTRMEMRSVETMPSGDVWMATATRGLLHYRDGTWVHVGQDRGLISSVMVYRTLRLDGQGRLWVGTEEGAVHSRDPLPTPERTPQPRLLGATINGTQRGADDRLSLRRTDTLSLQYTTLSFPGTRMQYQHRLTGTADSTWSAASTEPTLRLHGLSSGTRSVEIRARDGSGHYWSDPLHVPVHVRPVWYRTWWAYVLYGLGGMGALGGMAHLYAERRRAKKALRESRARLQGLANSIPGVIFQFYARPDGTRGNYFVSQQSARVLGLDPAPDDFFERFLECVPSSHRDDFIASVDRAIEQAEPWSFEGPFVKPSGETIWLQGVSTPEEREDELVFNGVVLDVTERKQLETQLHQAHKMETVGTLAGGIAHDFNNILHTASAYLELAGEEIAESNRAREFLRHTQKGLREAEALADKLLTFSRPDSTTVRERVAVDTLVQDTIDLTASSLSEDIAFDVQLDADCYVTGDPDQLRQVVLNLVTNAGRAMAQHDDPPDSGHVLAIHLEETEMSADVADRYLNLDAGAYVHLSVSDTGAGMDEDTMERIFDPFFTTEGSFATEASAGLESPDRGTGLGLSVAYSAVEAHGGDITVESKPGAGTTFDVYLPAADETGADPSSAEASVEAQEPHRA